MTHQNGHDLGRRPFLLPLSAYGRGFGLGRRLRAGRATASAAACPQRTVILRVTAFVRPPSSVAVTRSRSFAPFRTTPRRRDGTLSGALRLPPASARLFSASTRSPTLALRSFETGASSSKWNASGLLGVTDGFTPFASRAFRPILPGTPVSANAGSGTTTGGTGGSGMTGHPLAVAADTVGHESAPSG